MHARTLIAAALAAGLAVPAAASADTSLVGGPVKVRDYEMTLVGSDGGAKDSLTVMFSKVKGKSSQQHMYSFDSGVKVTPTAISGSLGRYGAVNLKLTGATTAKGTVPKGCTGKPGSTKQGTLSGSFKLVADKTYFKTVMASKLAGIASKGGNIRCDGAGGSNGNAGQPGRTTMLMLNEQTADGMFTFSATKDQQTASMMDEASATAPASIMHFISAQGSGLSAKGSDATAKAISPFFRGTGSFAGEGSGGTVTGTLGGSLVAAFDSIGPVEVEGDAMLMG